ncbi:MAG: hypothetical protein WC356_05110 [Candidatus Micrarchaeia archaeon]|jgi:hypothetical protein
MRRLIFILIVVLVTNVWAAEDSIRFGGTGSFPYDSQAIRTAYLNSNSIFDDSTYGKCSEASALISGMANGPTYYNLLAKFTFFNDSFAVHAGAIIDSGFFRVIMIQVNYVTDSVVFALVGIQQYDWLSEDLCGTTPAAGGATWNNSTTDVPWATAGAIGADDTLGHFPANNITIKSDAGLFVPLSFKVDTSILNFMKTWGDYAGGLGIYRTTGSGTNQYVYFCSEHYTAAYRPYLVVYYHLPAAANVPPNALTSIIGAGRSSGNADGMIIKGTKP